MCRALLARSVRGPDSRRTLAALPRGSATRTRSLLIHPPKRSLWGGTRICHHPLARVTWICGAHLLEDADERVGEAAGEVVRAREAGDAAAEDGDMFPQHRPREF
jgi:hypothetical protein